MEWLLAVGLTLPCEPLLGKPLRNIPFRMLRIDNLVTHLVGPISFFLRTQECVAITGPSGAGKSLFLRAVADLDPNQGEVWLNSRPRLDYSPTQWRRMVGLLSAESHWWAETVREHFPQSRSCDLAALGFDSDVLDWTAARLSSGERQRLGLLRLLNNQPQVLLLDEPTANLDSLNTERVETLIDRYLDSAKACALWITHDPAQIKRIADRVATLVDGRLAD